ncbi:ATP-dependent helicase deoxyribonuclease subunit B [Micractinium conductrix]|uniref:ATP-dependent helicase deoxyribonuclease subunit B n=1 Tax=Micractinium conductrix TaxID=554055 RepID=A0A2P6VBE6_9CHLO|nr:ATP-dependent helicase deoxyribonuclease subunit B [Micractinium conductrix]|eukprot:PSC71398.1 ATP-dependent helicase deoxyribonuclease subunit B [Micractinium conductrix]
MQRSSVEPLLRRLALRCLAALLLGVAAARATEFQESDFVPAARRAQFHGQRTHWHDILGSHCPKFGVKRLVAVPLPQPQGYKAADEYKLQLSFDGDSHVTPWLAIIGKHAASPPYVEVELVRTGSEIKSVSAQVFALDAEDQRDHAPLVKEFLNATHWPKHLLVHYTWRTQLDEDEESGLLVLFSAGAFVALLLGLNVARTYRDKLAAFLADVAGEAPGTGLGAPPVEKAETAVVRRAPSGGSLAATARSAAALPLNYPCLALTLALWVLGLFLAFAAKPSKISDMQLAAFNAKLKQAEAVVPDLSYVEVQLVDAEVEQAQHKVWFWRFKADARAAVAAHQPAVDAAQERVQRLRDRRDQLLREAKAELGLWSEAGVEEAREQFWESYASGKLFAQRQTFWDAFFVIIGSRERDWLAMLLNLLFRTLLNFFTGMCVSVFVFLFSLPSLIWSYQAPLWSGVAFFCLAAVAAVSVIASYLGLLFGAGATATYAALSMAAAHQQRLEGGYAPRPRLADGRAHHD